MQIVFTHRESPWRAASSARTATSKEVSRREADLESLQVQLDALTTTGQRGDSSAGRGLVHQFDDAGQYLGVSVGQDSVT